ncbi:hypothetical protein L3X38_025556 [Prunus dulcis]|uniref:Uncharacterized protein n=1 Tax=Prunus dulcis TaxID=3755 RepID=A0AAD4Z842_PRUDU|nr:hypothetical protein L3X38_025556 [Prunus dulcis]
MARWWIAVHAYCLGTQNIKKGLSDTRSVRAATRRIQEKQRGCYQLPESSDEKLRWQVENSPRLPDLYSAVATVRCLCTLSAGR